MALQPFQTSNNLTGLYLPEDTSRDISAFEQPDKPGFLEGFAFSANDALGNNPFINLAELAQQGIAKKFAPGKLLTKSGWESSEFFRPQLSFDALKTGDNSISENVARLAAARLDGDEATEARLNSMEPGFLSGATKFVGEAIGFVMDPLNIAAFKGTNLIIGKGNSLLLQKLGETRFARTRAAAFGAAEGAFITIPQAAIAFQTDKIFGQDPSAMAAIATVGLNAGLGGIIRGVFGFKEPITQSSYRDAMETAADQMSAGKSVDVGPITQNGYRDARLKDELQPEVTTSKAREEAAVTRDKNRRNISDLEEALVKGADKQKFDEKLRSKLGKEKGLSAKEILRKEKEISDKPGFRRDALDKVFLRKLPVNDEIKRAIDIRRTPKELRKPEEEQFLSDMIAGKEKDFIDKRLKTHREEIKDIESKLQESPGEIKDAERVIRDLDTFKEKLRHGESRLFEISGKRKPSPEVQKIKRDIDESKKKGEIFDKVIQHHEAELAMNNHSSDAVDHAQLSGASKKINSWEGDSVVNKEQNASFNREVEGLDDFPETELLEDIENAVKELELSEEDKKTLEDGEQVQENFETMKNAIRQAAECLIRSVS